MAVGAVYHQGWTLDDVSWGAFDARAVDPDMLAAIKDWVHEAEASGIQSLRDFADQLKTYSRRPAAAV